MVPAPAAAIVLGRVSSQGMTDGLDQWLPRTDVEPETWESLLDRLVRPRSAHLLYRGHGCYEWPLACSLARALRQQAQSGRGPIELAALESMVRTPNEAGDGRADRARGEPLDRRLHRWRGGRFPGGRTAYIQYDREVVVDPRCEDEAWP